MYFHNYEFLSSIHDFFQYFLALLIGQGILIYGNSFITIGGRVSRLETSSTGQCGVEHCLFPIGETDPNTNINIIREKRNFYRPRVI